MLIGGVAFGIAVLGGLLFAINSDDGKTTSSVKTPSSEGLSNFTVSEPIKKSVLPNTIGSDKKSVLPNTVGSDKMKKFLNKLKQDLKNNGRLTEEYEEILNNAITSCDTSEKEVTNISKLNVIVLEKLSRFLRYTLPYFKVFSIISSYKDFDAKTAQTNTQQLLDFMVDLEKIALNEKNEKAPIQKIVDVLNIKPDLNDEYRNQLFLGCYFLLAYEEYLLKIEDLRKDVSVDPGNHQDDDNDYNDAVAFNQNSSVVKYTKFLSALIDQLSDVSFTMFNLVGSIDKDLVKEFYTDEMINGYFGNKTEEYEKLYNDIGFNADADFDKLSKITLFGENAIKVNEAKEELEKIEKVKTFAKESYKKIFRSN